MRPVIKNYIKECVSNLSFLLKQVSGCEGLQVPGSASEGEKRTQRGFQPRFRAFSASLLDPETFAPSRQVVLF